MRNRVGSPRIRKNPDSRCAWRIVRDMTRTHYVVRDPSGFGIRTDGWELHLTTSVQHPKNNQPNDEYEGNNLPQHEWIFHSNQQFGSHHAKVSCRVNEDSNIKNRTFQMPLYHLGKRLTRVLSKKNLPHHPVHPKDHPTSISGDWT